MEIFISNNCINCGVCNQIYSEGFDIMKYGAIPHDKICIDEKKCLDAVFACPVNAIHIR